MTSSITEEQFAGLLATIERSAFRLETLDAYAVETERQGLDLFLAARPAPHRGRTGLTRSPSRYGRASMSAGSGSSLSRRPTTSAG